MILDYFENIKKEINDVNSMLNNTSVFNTNVMTSKLDKNILSQLNMGYSDGKMTPEYSNAIEKLASSYNEATAEANALKMAQDGLSKNTIKDILAKQSWTQTERNAAINSQAFKNVQDAATISMQRNTAATWKDVVATKAWSAVKKAGSILGGVAFSAAISIGISALIKFADQMITTKKEIKEMADTAKQEIDEIKNSFSQLKSTTNDIKNRFAELAQGVNQITWENNILSIEEYEEFLDLSNQLAELFPTLTRNYDDNGNAILNLSGDVNTIVSSLDNLIKKQQELTNQQILDKMPTVYADYENNIEKYSKKLDAAKKKQQDYLNTYNQLQNAEYDVSDDKKIVTFHFGNIDEEEKARLAEDLTNSFDDINDYVIQDLGTLDNHDTTITLYLDEEFNGFEARLQSAQEDIQKYNDRIKSEISSFSTYMNTWLQDNLIYQEQSPDMQKALQQVLFSKDWIKAAKEELGEDAGFKEIFSWIENEYIDAITSINNKEIKNDFVKLFTTELSVNDTIDIAQKLQDYFAENKIPISLDFILDEEDINSEQYLKNIFNNSLQSITGDDAKAYNELVKYTAGFSETQMNIWLEVTKDATNAGDAIKRYESYLDDIAKKSYENYNFFTDENLESIDKYKDTISDLSTYLESINDDNQLTSEEMSKLNTTYGITADSIEEYKNAIIELINKTITSSDIMIALAEAIENCDDEASKARLQSLYDNLQNIGKEAKESSTSFNDLATATSRLQGKAELLRDLKENIDKIGHIDSSKLDDIASTFPEMTEELAKYNSGLITSSGLFDALVEAYEADTNNYAKAVAFKLQYDTDYYKKFCSGLSDNIKNAAKSYGVDLENYANLNESKLALDKEYARRKAKLDSLSIDSELAKEMSLSSTDALGTDAASREKILKKKYDKYLKEKEKVDNLKNLIDEIEDSFVATIDLNLDWEKYGKDLTKDKDKNKDNDKDEDEIDWAEQSLKVLQKAVDDAQNALDDTHGYDNQIAAIKELNSALKNLRNGYKKVRKEYSNRYEGYLSQLKNGEIIRKYIESGTEFNLKEYDSDTAKIIQKAIDSYNDLVEVEDKIEEIDDQISDNKNIEKSKIIQEKYETKLEGVQTDLDNDTLTAKQKNELLDKQLKYQNKINEELIKQAEYEGNILEAENLRKENKKNERDTVSEKWQNKIDKNNSRIDAKNALLESNYLTEDNIDKINNTLEDLTVKDYEYQFNDIISQLQLNDVWDSYIKNLKEKYKQTKVNDEKFIKEHLEEISKHFSYAGLEELYYNFLNSIDEFGDKEYENHKTTRSYYINDNENKITNIQSDIDYIGGRGTKEQYIQMKNLHKSTLDYWKSNKEEAETFIGKFEEGTAGWDKWNSEIQECQGNIDKCEQSIKDCNIEILKLPLNDIEDALNDIQDKLDDINDSIDDQNTYISAASYILDTQIKVQEQYKQSIQDEIDALEEANDLRQTNLELQQAEYNLEKAKSQRSSKIFKEDQGWVYEADADEIRSAQEQYDEALYNKKISDLNRQIDVYDDEIERLNDIKEQWSQISTDVQGVCDLNKAIAYDSEFVNKVLSGNALLVQNIKDNMMSLYTAQISFEEQQERYQDTQELINDIIESYEREEIGYEQAQQQISNIIQTYYPKISEKYDAERDKIQEISNKKLENAKITKETEEEKNTKIEESNKEILESYTNLKKDLSKVFDKLNKMLTDYTKNVQDMASSVSAAISQVQSQLNSLPSSTTTITIDNSSTDNSSDKNKNNSKGKTTVKTAGKSHSGMELGYIGESNLSKDKKDFQYLALSKLDDSEVVRVLQKGEGVIAEPQIQNLMSNFRKITQAKIPAIPLKNNQSNQSINFNGDIIVNNPVGDSSSLAREIKKNLGSAMIQELYKK